jgi:hypothetical protein
MTPNAVAMPTLRLLRAKWSRGWTTRLEGPPLVFAMLLNPQGSPKRHRQPPATHFLEVTRRCLQKWLARGDRCMTQKTQSWERAGRRRSAARQPHDTQTEAGRKRRAIHPPGKQRERCSRLGDHSRGNRLWHRGRQWGRRCCACFMRCPGSRRDTCSCHYHHLGWLRCGVTLFHRCRSRPRLLQ